MDRKFSSNMETKTAQASSTKSAHRIRERNATLEATMTRSGRERSAKDKHILKGETASEPTVTQSDCQPRRYLTTLALAWLGLSSSFVTGYAQEVPTTTTLSMRDSSGTELSQRNALHHLPESTDLASSSDSRRQYKNMGPDKFSQWQVGKDWPTAHVVECIAQDDKARKEILSACQNPESMKKFFSIAGNNKCMEILSSMLLDEHFITLFCDLYQNPKVRDNVVALEKNKKLMDRVRPLLNDKINDNLKQILNARQEEVRSHNLDATQEPFKRQKGSMRKLLIQQRSSRVPSYETSRRQSAEFKRDSNYRDDPAFSEFLKELQRCNDRNREELQRCDDRIRAERQHCDDRIRAERQHYDGRNYYSHTMLGMVIIGCFAYIYKQAGDLSKTKSDLKEEKERNVEATIAIAQEQTNTKREQEKAHFNTVENKRLRVLVEELQEENDSLRGQMIPATRPITDALLKRWHSSSEASSRDNSRQSSQHSSDKKREKSQ
jgi:hypothetical protein